VTEPVDLWEQRLDLRLRDRAPRVIENPGAGPRWLFAAEGATPFPLAGSFAAGRSGQASRASSTSGPDAPATPRREPPAAIPTSRQPLEVRATHSFACAATAVPAKKSGFESV